MNHLLRVLIIIVLLICVLIGCEQPVGSIDVSEGRGNGNGDAGEMDLLWLVPGRWNYLTEQWFVARDDLQIMYAGRGAMKEIPFDTPGLEIRLLEHARSVDNPNTILINNGEVRLNTPGSHHIKVTYDGKSAHYTIEVRGVYTDGETESDIFDVIWL